MYGRRGVNLIPRCIHLCLRQHDAIDRKIRDTAARDGVIIGLPNDQGQLAHFTDHMLPGYYVEEVKEIKDKLSRAVPFAARVEAQDVSLVRAEGNVPFINEVAEFPGSRHDD